ncbi:hypothetical protein BCR44DRAFT_117475 [Catenaria anguillulae PL171]|uniref:Thioredoxin domain-containing protein n=1 Tax=Catenaria anguillulae PL171 TaxID=765915 RepID=A0A1Y2HW27_9FUNG|nr:hypothetical protein BCR44DRAFT_117475 [Catenaria anguillulae PL171]
MSLAAPAKVPDVLAQGLPWQHFVNSQGEPASLASLRRPLTIYSFTAAWCPPCRALAPHIASVHESHAETDVDIVYVGLEYNRQEHDEKNQLPYFRFAWDNVEVPQGLPADCENPFWLSHWATVKALGKMGIPTTIVVDAATGTIVDRAVDLALAGQPSKADIARAVAQWRAGRSASTFWMRSKYWIITHSFVTFFRVRRFFREWIATPFRRLISGPPKPAPMAEVRDVAEETTVEETAEEVAGEETTPLLAAEAGEASGTFATALEVAAPEAEKAADDQDKKEE